MISTMLHRFLIVVLLLLAAAPSFAVEHLRMATTTSTANTGLLAELLPPFEKTNNCEIDVIAVGTGKAIKLGEAGDVDVLLVHARSKEDTFVAEGFGVGRQDVMYNDFVLLGPSSDPAGISGTSNVALAMARIVQGKATFVSRGDDSSTHTREKQLWSVDNVTPVGDWYLEAGRGMGEVIIMTGERQGYTLSDRATYLACKEKKTPLRIVAEGDSRLLNPYGVIRVNPQKHSHVNVELAQKFIDFLISPEAKALITGYHRSGEQLFYL